MQIDKKLIFTDLYESLDDFGPEKNSAYLYAHSVEKRSWHVDKLMKSTKSSLYIEIVENDYNVIDVVIDENEVSANLKNKQEIYEFLDSIDRETIYIDITGLSHQTWARLIQVAIETKKEVNAIYVEPGKYKFSSSPTEGEIFDLSERITGIKPLPGFISLSDVPEEQLCFVPLLGFEGTRLSYVYENVQPLGGNIVPIIGVPGFRPEYMYYAYHGNRLFLLDTEAWKKVRYARANCPFSLFYLLEEIEKEMSGYSMIIAPIGTKPHALGAVLYAIKKADSSELIYDHPIRKATRTEEVDRLLVYHISSFMELKDR